MKKLGTNIKRLRQMTEIKKPMNQRDLAKVVGRTAASISIIESGGCVPSLEIAIKIAKALNVSLDDLVNGDFNKDEKK